MKCYNCDGWLYGDNGTGMCDDCARVGICSYCGKSVAKPKGCERCGYGDGTDCAYVCEACAVANTCGLCGKEGGWCCVQYGQYDGGGYEKDMATEQYGDGTPVVGRPTECCGSYFCTNDGGKWWEDTKKGEDGEEAKACDEKHKTKTLECGHQGCELYPRLGDFEGNTGDKKCRTCDMEKAEEHERSRTNTDMERARNLIKDPDTSKMLKKHIEEFIAEAEEYISSNPSSSKKPKTA